MFSREIKYEVVKQVLLGVSVPILQKQYGIKGTATIHEWVWHFKRLGIAGLESHVHLHKTSYAYSDKLKVISWRSAQRASLPETAKHFKIRSPAMIWQWEKAFKAGRLSKQRGRPKMTDKKDQRTPEDKLKLLKEENELLQLRNAYLEKLHALVEKKNKSQTKKKPK